MLKQWIGTHRSLFATVTSGTVIAALIATVAIVSSGYTAQRLGLNDSSVWVANGSALSIGRANTTIHQLNSVVPAGGPSLDVLQDGATVLLADYASNKLDIVDPATSTVSHSVPLPPGRPHVYLHGGTVVITSEGTGQVWITSLGNLPTFDSQAAPTLSLGAGTISSMDDAGLMFAYSPTARRVYRVDPASSATVTSDAVRVATNDQLGISSVAGQWILLDAPAARLYLAGRTVSLHATPAAQSGELQQASSSGTEALVAGVAGLVAVPLGGGSSRTVTTVASGTPAPPFIGDGCEFAAWSSGTAWRQCAGQPAGVNVPLTSMPGAPKLSIAHNGARVVLNDQQSGATWAIQDAGQLIDNWSELMAPKDQQQQNQQKLEDTPPVVEQREMPPVAVDDHFGARPGRTTMLPVLLNDYDPDGDVLAITDVTPISASVGRIDVIKNRQELQITLADTASGTVSFSYTITDGHGGSASANVTVTIRTPGENSAPAQARPTKTIVAQGGRVTTNVLGDWVDPDGDPVYVTSASVPAPDSVTFQPDGTVVYTDAGTSTGLKQISIAVSDGKATGTGVLNVTVQPAGKVPIIAEPFIVVVGAGQEVTVNPLDHVRGGTGTLRLGSVPSKTGVTITPSYESGTFRLASSQVGTHYLDYVVTDGQQSVTGTARVEVVAPPDPNAKPITIPQTVFVRSLNTQSVDVAGADIDPAGGVLLVTGVSGLDPASGISAEIVQQQFIRVTLTAPLAGPVTFHYSISNGLSSADGTVTVIEIPVPARLQPPIANDDSITVRVGAAIDIPVLDNDVDPDGQNLTLEPTLPQNVAAGGGLLFASGRVLRYLAPAQPGNYTAVYQVAGPDGQTARAKLHIAVREIDVSTNNPPVPQTVTARVLAGSTVTIPIPLSGIDPDGDSVQLLGQDTNPEKGSVVAVGANSITYKAGDYSTGTDSFSYSVVDALGARATGEVRVGISARLGGARNPVAVLDAVTVRPGITVSVPVLANDSDPDGSPLHVISAVPNDRVTKATVVKDIVVVKPPATPGVYGVVYTIQNDTGGTSTSFVRVTVDPNAPLSFPVASDTVLTLSDILGHPTVDADVLANVFFADGNARDLGLTIYPGYGSTAQMTANKHILVTVTPHSQIIPFRVTHPRDPNVYTSAFLWVPGTDDALPQLNRRAPALQVKSEDRLVINLANYVLAVGGKTVQLTDSSTVRATHSNGDNLVVNNTTLAFTSAPRYFGPASISFEVTDGQSATDPNGHKSTLVLPITVLPRDNQPPVFGGALLDFEPGEQKVLDLVKLTNYPYANDLAELNYSVFGTPPVGFTTQLSGQKLTITANDNAAKGTNTSVTIGVRDALAQGTAGRIQLSVVPSTRPLAQAATASAVARRGQTTVVNVLAGDNATNPFPSQPLRVIDIRGLGGSTVPVGVAISPSADKSTLTVAASASAAPVDTTLQYEVADATNDPSRYVWGTVTISVQDKPDPVTSVHVTDFGNQRLTLAWNAGAFNNSPITGYEVAMTNAATGAAISTTSCGGALCDITTPGNGPTNAVRFTVVAKNAIGTSGPSGASAPAWSDVVPAAPASLGASPLDHGLTISWRKSADGGGGSPITKYVISIDGLADQEVAVPGGDPVGTLYSRAITDPSIANGSSLGFSVSARNGALPDLASWNKASGTGRPAGPPQAGSAPKASASVDDGTTASLSWDGVFSANGRAVSNYYAGAFTSAPPDSLCAVSPPYPAAAPDSVPGNSGSFQDVGTATSFTFSGLTPNTTYYFRVYAFNGMGCTGSTIVTATPRARPGDVAAVNTSGPNPNGSNTWDFQLNGFTIASGSTDADTFEYRLQGSGVDGGTYGPLALPSFLQTTVVSQYGQDVSVFVKACKTYETTLCSADWQQQPFHLGVPVRNTALGGLTFTHDAFGSASDPPATGTWSWTSSPGAQQPGYDSVTYSCGGTDTPLVGGSGGSCSVVDDGNGTNHHFPDLIITINANHGAQYPRTYTLDSSFNPVIN